MTRAREPTSVSSAAIRCTESKAPASTSLSTTGRETWARCQKSLSEAKGLLATIRSTSASLIPLTSASASRRAYPTGSSGDRSTVYSRADLLTSRGRMPMPNWRASSRMSRLGYMPGSWVSTPARKCAGQWVFSQADW